MSSSDSSTLKYRHVIRDALGEFCGVMILVIFGVGVNCQVVLSTDRAVVSSPRGDYLSIAFGWAAGLALGAWMADIIRESPGHINPAVTLALELRALLLGKQDLTLDDYGSKRWAVPLRIVVFTFSQLLGGIVGAAIIYVNYVHAIDIFEGDGIRTVPGTATLFATYAAEYMTPVSCFFDEFLGTAILLLVICALSDLHDNWESTSQEQPSLGNSTPDGTAQGHLLNTAEHGEMTVEQTRMSKKLDEMAKELDRMAKEQTRMVKEQTRMAKEQFGAAPGQGTHAPFILFIVTLGIVVALGMQTGFALNPARDLGPRILTAMVGYGKAGL